MRVLLAILLLTGCLGSTTYEPRVDDSFEGGMGPWQQDEHLPDDPNNPGAKVGGNASAGDRARTGDKGLRLAIDGRQDDGTIWVERALNYEPGTRYAFNASFWAWSASESFNILAHAVAYLGPDDPEREEDFPQPMQNSGTEEFGHGGLREPLNRAQGWERYTFTWVGTIPDDGVMHFAIGISAVWETEMVYDIDDVMFVASQA